MRLCVPLPCFFSNTDFCLAIRKIGELGYDAAEIYNWEGLDLNEVNKTCRDCGVDLLSMCTTEFRMTDPNYSQLWLDGLKRSCEAANVVGANKLITQVGPDTGDSREIQNYSITENLMKATQILKSYGVTIMIEPLNIYVDHPGYYLWSSKEAFEIVRKVSNNYVKVVYDIYHQQVMEGNIIPNITANLDCIAHLHAAGHPGRHELQYGENDYINIFKAIDNSGYKGACGLEYNPIMDPKESLKKAKELYGGNK